MRLVAMALLLAACSSKQESPLSAEDRAKALDAAKQCTDAVDTLAPSYQMVGPKLATALKMDRAEAQRLMRDSIELLISTREMLCSISQATIDSVLAMGRDGEVTAAQTRVKAGRARLADVRAAYDQLLGAASSAQVRVDEAALLERMTKTLGQ